MDIKPTIKTLLVECPAKKCELIIRPMELRDFKVPTAVTLSDHTLFAAID